MKKEEVLVNATTQSNRSSIYYRSREKKLAWKWLYERISRYTRRTLLMTILCTNYSTPRLYYLEVDGRGSFFIPTFFVYRKLPSCADSRNKAKKKASLFSLFSSRKLFDDDKRFPTPRFFFILRLVTPRWESRSAMNLWLGSREDELRAPCELLIAIVIIYFGWSTCAEVYFLARSQVSWWSNSTLAREKPTSLIVRYVSLIVSNNKPVSVSFGV